MFRDRHMASRPRPAARGAPPAIIIREDSASTFTFSSPRSTGQKWPQRRSLATSRWWVPTATQTKGRQANGSTTLTEQHIPSCGGCPRNCDNYGAALGIPPRNDASGWNVGKLNGILENNLVPGTKGHLRT